jgi:hypothetical protein
VDLFTPHVDLFTSGKQKTSVRSQLTSSIVGDKTIGHEALQIRDIAVGLLRKEFALRTDVDGYLERRKAEIVARAKLDETEADIQSKQELVGDKTIHENRRKIEELKSLIRFEAVGSKYSADHEVQWRTSVRSPGANASPSNRTLDLAQPALQDRTRRSGAESRDRFPRLSQPDVVDLQLKCRNPPRRNCIAECDFEFG